PVLGGPSAHSPRLANRLIASEKTNIWAQVRQRLTRAIFARVRDPPLSWRARPERRLSSRVPSLKCVHARARHSLAGFMCGSAIRLFPNLGHGLRSLGA